MAVIQRIYRSPTSAAEKRGLLTNTMGSRLRQSKEVRRACWSRISIFGKAQNGCAASNSSLKTRQGSGSRSAITTTATLGRNSDTREINRHGAAAQMATREGALNSAGNAEGKESHSRAAGLDHAPGGAAR